MVFNWSRGGDVLLLQRCLCRVLQPRDSTRIAKTNVLTILYNFSLYHSAMKKCGAKEKKLGRCGGGIKENVYICIVYSKETH